MKTLDGSHHLMERLRLIRNFIVDWETRKQVLTKTEAT